MPEVCELSLERGDPIGGVQLLLFRLLGEHVVELAAGDRVLSEFLLYCDQGVGRMNS